MRPSIAVALLLLSGSAEAREANCMARMIVDVAAEEAPEEVRSKKNGDFGPVTQVKVNKTSGKMVFCSANSYCYNSNAFELITPCRLKRDASMSDGTWFSFFTR